MRALALASRRTGAAAPPLRVLRVHDRAELSHEDLLTRVAQGDRVAFAALFDAYAGRVKGYLLRLGAAGAIAEDLAQDAMVAVWRRAATYDAARAKASTWIFVIARNCWIDKLRREKVELAYRASLENAEAGSDAPDEVLEREDAAGRMRAIVDTLSEEQKAVVRLSFFEEKPHSEIAAELKLPLGTVKSRLRLAMMKLRTQWGERR
jgi:RNA polymerase sigma-70 factor (ECF subfamily)